jgi:type IV secretory pathway TrbD component
VTSPAGGAASDGAGSSARARTFAGAPATGAAADAAPSGLPRRVHPALLRDVLYAGVERPVIALEATIAIGLVATVGPRLVTLAAVAVIVGLIHPAMAWVTSQDPLATAVYVRSLWWKDYYAPHAGVRATGRVKPTLPRI